MTTGGNDDPRSRPGRHAMPEGDTPAREPSVRPPSGSTGQGSTGQAAGGWVPPADSAATPESAGATGGSATAVATAEREPARPDSARRKAISEGKSAERRLAFWLVAPAALMMLLVTGYPIIYAFWLSLNKMSLSAPGEREFVWFSNYATVLTDSYWWTSFFVTTGITVVSVAIELVLGMAIALVMHRTIFGRGTIRTVVLIPYGIVTVAAAFSWYYAWTPETGYLANLLPDGTAPLTEQWPSLAIIVLAEVWKTTPFMALLLLAGLALVPDDLLKAAQVDGAGAWTRLWRIIIPLMKPAILVALLFRTLDAFRIFDNIYVLTRGSNNTYSVSMLGYDNLFKAFNLGIGSAISVLIFVCVAIIAFIFVKGFGTAAPGSENEGR
ncbi:ABC transporter permease subunit [Gordonia sp. LSe1-13]|uniref:ABC transporter permease subunit n=1 Tax=Gordonia sesuvii TaxID=3116777 RepID=A0ABU7M6M6_9ACTN|nr:ABC transporter permease subunit [Gordonia sp. LSe1-13]